MAGDGSCSSYPSDTSQREEPGTQVEGRAGLTSRVSKEIKTPLLWAEAKRQEERKKNLPPILKVSRGLCHSWWSLLVFSFQKPFSRRKWSSFPFPLNEHMSHNPDGRLPKRPEVLVPIVLYS